MFIPRFDQNGRFNAFTSANLCETVAFFCRSAYNKLHGIFDFIFILFFFVILIWSKPHSARARLFRYVNGPRCNSDRNGPPPKTVGAELWRQSAPVDDGLSRLIGRVIQATAILIARPGV